MLPFVVLLAIAQVAFAIRLFRASTESLLLGILGLVLFPFLLAIFPMLASPVLLFQSLALAATLILFRSAPLPSRYFTASSIIGSLAVFGICAYFAHADIQARRRAHPIVDLKDRMAYETNEQIARVGPPILSDRTQERLAQAEINFARYSDHYRARLLQRLHTNWVAEFATSQGFGVSRMHRLSHSPQRTATPIEVPDRQPDTESASEERAIDPGELTTTPPQRLEAIHDESIASFLAPETFGYIADRQQAADFISHGFQVSWEAPEAPKVAPELVSLLKHDPPGVYVSKYLPRMDELKDAPTRPLDDFESQALIRLREGEDIVVLETKKDYRMLGSIRAASQCLECHSVERGALLGAFSYELGAPETTSDPARRIENTVPAL